VHITVGDAGNPEGLSFTTGGSGVQTGNILPKYEDINGGCEVAQNASVKPGWNEPNEPPIDHFAYYKRVLTYQANGNSSDPSNPAVPKGYCYASQPIWSQYRDPSFGHGTFDALNATHALWQFHRNQDGNDVIADLVYIVRDTNNCPNFLGQPITPAGLTGPAVNGPVVLGGAYNPAASGSSVSAAGR
jgi:hypothetical protein